MKRIKDPLVEAYLFILLIIDVQEKGCCMSPSSVLVKEPQERGRLPQIPKDDVSSNALQT